MQIDMVRAHRRACGQKKSKCNNKRRGKQSARQEHHSLAAVMLATRVDVRDQVFVKVS